MTRSPFVLVGDGLWNVQTGEKTAAAPFRYVSYNKHALSPDGKYLAFEDPPNIEVRSVGTGQVKGMFMGNDGGVGVLADEILWSSGHQHLKDGKIDFTHDDVVGAYTQAQQFFKDVSARVGVLRGCWDGEIGIPRVSRNRW